MIAAGGTAQAPNLRDRLKPYEGRLTAEQRALAALLFQGAEASRTSAAAQAEALGALEASLARAATGTQGLAVRFDQAMTQAIVASNDRDAMLGFVRAYADLVRQAPSRAVLEALVRDHLPAADVAPTLALLTQLTDGDVAEVFAAVGAEFRAKFSPLVGVTDLALVGCQEDVPFNSPEGYKAFNDASPYPFLNRPDFTGDNIFAFCRNLPPALPFEGFHDPVQSDIPTLVLWGLNDTQTSMKDALLAADSLANARAVGFPETGHGAIVFSKCARDVGAAFVERPGEAPDTACTADLKPRWILPPP
jgi:pimeloyl-ACP methyl ester carboxylesterase